MGTDLGALYGPLIFHMLPASVHRIFVNTFKGNITLKYLCPGQQLAFKLRHYSTFNELKACVECMTHKTHNTIMLNV